jgi:recombinational DNA repair protein RecT
MSAITISFKDLIKAATDSGCITWVQADVVHANDDYKTTLAERPTHSYNAFSERGAVVGAYCVAKLTSGDYLTETMTLDELMQAKKMAKTKSVWEQWPNEMFKKCVIKRAAKRWPLSGSAAVAVQQLIDEDNKDYQLSQPKAEKLKTAITDAIWSKMQSALVSGEITPDALLAKPYDFTAEQKTAIEGFKNV